MNTIMLGISLSSYFMALLGQTLFRASSAISKLAIGSSSFISES